MKKIFHHLHEIQLKLFDEEEPIDKKIVLYSPDFLLSMLSSDLPNEDQIDTMIHPKKCKIEDS